MTVNTRTLFLYFALLSVLLITISACQTAPVTDNKEEKVATISLTDNALWANAIAQGDDLTAFYTDEAVHIAPDGSYMEGSTAISSYWSGEGKFVLDTTLTLAAEEAGRETKYAYEIEAIQAEDGTAYRQFIIKAQEDKRRVLEFSARAQIEDRPAATVLDTFRSQWINRCNAHNAYELVAGSYTPNALYYNHKPLVIGTEAIAEEYSYMNRPKYELYLDPIVVEMVSQNLAYEIGQCSGSYGGKYMLVWQRNNAGEWQVLFDSNI